MVVYEVARALCFLPNVDRASLSRPVQVLQLFLSNHKATVKFGAMRTLSQLAMIHPEAVAACNLDMESLISDSNRSIATFAITTLLKVVFHHLFFEHKHVLTLYRVYRPVMKPRWTDS